MRLVIGLLAAGCYLPLTAAASPETATAMVDIRTPPPAPQPRINGAPVFGVRPGHPFLFHIAATGERPLTFSADGLPTGLQLDPETGNITGTVTEPGKYNVTLRARNRLGTAEKPFQIVVGETLALTPPMGWNSWNHYATRVSQAVVLANAQAMAKSGLIDHGWTYVNIDDSWQGERGGRFGGIQGNAKFPDLKALCDEVHALGLKIGIYSTPWIQSYAGYTGGSAMNPEGRFTKYTGSARGRMNGRFAPWIIGRYTFEKNDARQWADWGIDYLKYDWYPNGLPATRAMYDALRASGRDIVLSLSNSAPFQDIPQLSRVANSWRIYGDIKANWKRMITEAQVDDKWRPYARPGHWNDPDMLEIATHEHGQPGLTHDEEYTHMTWWCLLSAPLLLGNDLAHMDAFTLNVLTNDEVIAIDQDALGQQAAPVAHEGACVVYEKKLADGTVAVGLFNLGEQAATVTARWADLHLRGRHHVRDLWRQKDLGTFQSAFSMPVAPHSAELVKISR